MPRSVPVRPEAGLDIDREAGGANDAPQNRDPPNFFGAIERLTCYLTAGPDQPAVPDAGKHSQDDQLAPEQRTVIASEFRTGRVQSGRERKGIIPEPEKDVGCHDQRAAPEQRLPTDQPVGRMW